MAKLKAPEGAFSREARKLFPWRDAACVSGNVVVAVPRIVSVMVVALDERLAFEFSMLVLAISEADDLVKLGSALVFVHVDAIAKTDLIHGISTESR